MPVHFEQELLKLLQSPVKRSTRTNLYKVLGMTWEEERHSNIVAWLLDPSGPFMDGWLLNCLLQELGQGAHLGSPTAVQREVQKGADRADIVIDWPNFRLVIENKIQSPEGPGQCLRYLEAFEITGPERGRLVFLTPSGRWPRSIPVGDSRVCPLSYRVLRRLIEQGVTEGVIRDTRTHAQVAEYADALRSLTGEEMSQNDRPQIPETTLEVIRVHPQWKAHYGRAVEDSHRFIEWTVHQVRAAIQRQLGCPEVVESWAFRYACLLRLPEWVARGCEFGVAYSAESRLGERLMTDYNHLIGVHIRALDGTAPAPAQPDIATEIRKVLSADSVKQGLVELLGSNVQRQLTGSNIWWAVSSPFAIGSDEQWDNWTQRMTDKVSELAVIVRPALDAIIDIHEPS